MPPVLTHRNQQLYIDLAPLLEAGLEDTYLAADVAAAGAALTVRDIDGFAVNQILVIGELGTEACEIVKTHAATAPAGTTVTLVAGGVEFAHGAGTRIRRIQYNQIELSHSATLAGSKSVLATVDIQTDQLVQAYTDTSQSSGYYFARFKDSIASTFGPYTDGLEYGGWDDDTVGYMIETALRDNSVRLSEDLSRQDCYGFLTEGIKTILGKQLHFPQQQQLNYVAGQTVPGVNIVALPADIYDPTTNQSIKAVRAGRSKLVWVDPQEFAELMLLTSVTQVRTQASPGATTLEVDNSYDFGDSGTISIYISGTKYDITYTGVTRSATAGILTGIPDTGEGSIPVTIPVDSYVWQDQEEGTPTHYTVRNGNLEYWPLCDSSHANKNIEMDYWTVATVINSDGDVIDLQRHGMLLDYLRWRIRMKMKNGGALDTSDGYYGQFKEKLNDAIRTSRPLFRHKMNPRLNRIDYHRG